MRRRTRDTYAGIGTTEKIESPGNSTEIRFIRNRNGYFAHTILVGLHTRFVSKMQNATKRTDKSCALSRPRIGRAIRVLSYDTRTSYERLKAFCVLNRPPDHVLVVDRYIRFLLLCKSGVLSAVSLVPFSTRDRYVISSRWPLIKLN